MSDYIFNPANKQQPLWKKHLQRAVRAIQKWFRQLVYSLIEIVILFTATAVLVGILLSFMEAFWYLYLQTPVGIKYTADPSRLSVHKLTQLIHKDLFLFSIEIAATALTACLMLSIACQVLAVRRYFYVGRGLINRVIWLLLFSAAAGYLLTHTSQIDLQLAIWVMIAPCLCLFSSCLNISNRLLPELTPFAIIDMIIRIKNASFKTVDQIPAEPLPSLNRMRRDCFQTTATGSSAPARKTHRISPRSDKVPG